MAEPALVITPATITRRVRVHALTASYRVSVPLSRTGENQVVLAVSDTTAAALAQIVQLTARDQADEFGELADEFGNGHVDLIYNNLISQAPEIPAPEIPAPVVAGAKVTAEVVDLVRTRRVLIFKKTRRKGYRRLNGHRQSLAKIRVTSISA